MRFAAPGEQTSLLTKFHTVDSLRGFVLLLSLASLAGCASTASPRYASLGGSGAIDPRYGVRASPRVIADGEEVPKGGGNYMVGKPYKIAGQTYVPNEKPAASVGTASWYGSDFHGRRTANGEIFDRESISAAHPTMPLPSYARVTNLRNARSMVVRVNDRGPYHGGRVMDVSQRVAEALDFRSAGTAKVKVEWIGRADLAGDDDRKLLATLRDDGEPATLNGVEPTMVAARQEPVRTAALVRPSRAPEPPIAQPAAVRTAAPPVVDDIPPPRPGASELMAYANDEARPEPLSEPTAREEQLVDVDPVSSTHAGKGEEKARAFQSAPLPPLRPASLSRVEASIPSPPTRQATN
jgi:rare lipoprotein A